MYLFAICIFSLIKYLFMPSAHFLIGSFGFLWLNLRVAVYFRYWSCVRYVVCKQFLPVCSLSFHPFHRVLCEQKFLILRSTH